MNPTKGINCSLKRLASATGVTRLLDLIKSIGSHTFLHLIISHQIKKNKVEGVFTPPQLSYYQTLALADSLSLHSY